jgi:hypothetical protein
VYPREKLMTAEESTGTEDSGEEKGWVFSAFLSLSAILRLFALFN